jgi:hypothetical protein
MRQHEASARVPGVTRHLATFTLGLAAGALLALLLASTASSRQPSAPRPAQTVPIPVGVEKSGDRPDVAAQPTVPTLRPVLSEALAGPTGQPPSPTTGKRAASSEVPATATPSPGKPRATTRPAQGRSGVATWFRAPAGTAAAGPALRAALGRDWRGRVVTVNGIRVRLTDWCACGHGRIIDLNAGTFARIAPLSRGVVTVTVRW